MMAANESAASVTDRLGEEHRLIFRLVADVEASFALKLPMNEWVETVTHRLMELGELMAPHFRYERDSPLYDEAYRRAPHLAAEARRLLVQHEFFLNEVGAIFALARGTLDPDEALVMRIKARLTALFEALRRHEADENELVARAFQEDLGGGD